MKLLQGSRHQPPRAKTITPAAPYLRRGADEARRLGHNYVGTEHVLLALVRDPDGDAVRVLKQLGVAPDAIEQTLAGSLCGGEPTGKIDPQALAALGIDFEAVRARLEHTFGPGALERTRSACLGIAPRLKLALAYALDLAAGEPLLDKHVLLGILTVPESVAARALNEVGITLDAATTVAVSHG